MNILDKINNGLLIFDGGFGTMLQSRGLPAGCPPDLWNMVNPDEIVRLQKEYLMAGADMVTTATFSVNRLKFNGNDGMPTVGEVVRAAVNNAKRALRETGLDDGEHYIALDLGPTGKLLRPLGDLSFDEAVDIYREVIEYGVKCGVDAIACETFNDLMETRAAVLAAHEVCDLPVFATNVYDEAGKQMTGADPETMIAVLEGLRVDALGMNCSLGPREMLKILPQFEKYSSTPIMLQPNAGLPRSVDGKTVYDVSADEFAEIMAEAVRHGARIIGGCCGTTPEYIRKMKEAVKDITPMPLTKKHRTVVTSYTHAVTIGDTPLIIGERINPTGKKLMKQALRDGDIGYLINEAVSQTELGAHMLDVNVGLPEINEVAVLCQAVAEIQNVTDVPLQIDTSDPTAMEAAMRVYRGKPLLNSVNGKAESMDAVFPLMKKYGGVAVALTLDENGIPDTADGRVAIAEKILRRADEYGISHDDIIFDTLTMAVSSDPAAAMITLDALEKVKSLTGCGTVLGVSNVSFGLPTRDSLNSAFFTLALARGLDCAIMNPKSQMMMRAFRCYAALTSADVNFADYIGFAEKDVQMTSPSVTSNTSAPAASVPSEGASPSALHAAIVRGMVDEAYKKAVILLETVEPTEVINAHIIPALDKVGEGFGCGKLFLPQLLMSAEAAKSAFTAVSEKLASSGTAKQSKGRIVLATVKGDIHDIGKNIVRTLLENYGYDVIDLGRDVAPEIIVDTAIRENVRLVGLSALMTTTVASMEATIKLLRQKLPSCRVAVGGAVMTAEYAAMICADKYCRDAMDTVRYAEEILG